MLVSQCSQVFSKRSGRIRVRPDRVASSARAASGRVRMNHCVLSRGSTTSSLRWQRPMTISWGASATRSPRAVEVGHDPRRGRRSGPARRSGVPGVRDRRVVGEDRRRGEAVAQAGLVVVVVVGRRDLDGAGPEASLDDVVGDDRHVALDERDAHRAADERRVARVVGMDRHRGVAEDRLGPGRGDRDRRVRVGLRRSPRRSGGSGSTRAGRSPGVETTSRSLTLVRHPGHQLMSASVR